MSGHISERRPGIWNIVLHVLDPQTGKRKHKWHTFRGGKREAQKECDRLAAEYQSGTGNLAPKATTVRDYLTKWLAHMTAQISPASHERYSGVIIGNLIPTLGAVALIDLRAPLIAKVYGDLIARGLSPRSVLLAHKVLKQALAQAVAWELIGRNPADTVTAPRVERSEMSVLDTDATARLIEAARGSSLFAPILLGALCGLRRGEIVALKWSSVDLAAGSLSVVQSMEQTKAGVRLKAPKNGKGRNVAMPSLLIEELRRYRLAESERLLALGVRLTDDHHVALREDGNPWIPLRLTHAFRTLALQHRVAIRFHDLRHSHATQLLASGVHPKVAQERLGHSSIAMTIDLYSHVLPGMQEQAVGLVDTAMRAAFQRQRK
jgi:integrase